MAATPNKDLALPASGDLNWNDPLNKNFSMLDAALGATQYVNLAGYSGGPIILTPTFPVVTSPLTSLSYIPARLELQGLLTENVVIEIPDTVLGNWIVANWTTGGYTVTFTTGRAGYATYAVPQGGQVEISSDGYSITPVGIQTPAMAIASPGDIKISAAINPPAGWLICNGQAVDRNTYLTLYAAIGTTYGAGNGSTTFNVPNLVGRVVAGIDTAGTTLDGAAALGDALGEQTHVLTWGELAAHTHPDAGHTHTDAGHNHAAATTAGPYGFAGGGVSLYAAQWGVTNSGNANIETGYAAIETTGSSVPHNNVQPTMALNYFIYAGV